MTTLRPTVVRAGSDQPGHIGVALGSALYIAAVLGTGILLLPTLAARAAGPASLWIAAAVAVVGPAFAWLAATVPSPTHREH